MPTKRLAVATVVLAIVLSAVIYREGRKRSQESGAPNGNENLPSRSDRLGQKSDAQPMSKQALKASIERLVVGTDEPRIELETTIVNGDSPIDFQKYFDAGGNLVKLTINREGHLPSVRSFSQFYDDSAEYAGVQGVRILRAIPLKDPDVLGKIARILDSGGSVPNGSGMVETFVPVEVVSRTGKRSNAWLQASLTLEKQSMVSGIPNGITEVSPGTALTAYRSYWTLWPMDISEMDDIYTRYDYFEQD